MTAFELYLDEKQKLMSLLYLARRIKAATLLARIEGAQEMSLLRLLSYNPTKMTPENRKRIQDATRVVGDELKGKLFPHPWEGAPARNSYAHVWGAIKDKFGKSYKECDDSQVDEILALIEEVRLNSK